MSLTSNESQFLLWALLTLIGVLGFIGALGVNALIKMARDINEIKLTVMRVDTKHDALEKRVEKLEEINA